MGTFIDPKRIGKGIERGIVHIAANGLDLITKFNETNAKFDRQLAESINKPEVREFAIKEVEKVERGELVTRDQSNKLKKWIQEASPENRNFVDSLAEGVGSMGGFLVVAAASGGSTIIPSMTEALMESASVYEELRSTGSSVAQASKPADATLIANLAINYFTNKIGILSDRNKGLIKAALSAAGEGVQEGLQQLSSNIALGRDPMEGVLESMGVGGILGGTATVILPGGQKLKINTETKQITEPSGASEKLVAEKKDGVQTVPIKNVQTDLLPVVEERANTQTPKIKTLEESFKRGDPVPPIPVFERDGKFVTNKDGFHRLQAQRNIGVTDIQVRVEPKTTLTGTQKQQVERAKAKAVIVPKALEKLAIQASKFISAKDFATTRGTVESKQIGTLAADRVVPRDKVDTSSETYKALEQNILKNGIQDPIIVEVRDDGTIETTEGSNRVTIAQANNLEVPVIITKGQLDGLQTISEFYEQVRQAAVEKKAEPKKTGAKPLKGIIEKKKAEIKPSKKVDQAKKVTKKAKKEVIKPLKAIIDKKKAEIEKKVKEPTKEKPKKEEKIPKGFKESRVIERVKNTLQSEVDISETIYKTLTLDDAAKKAVDIVNNQSELTQDIIDGTGTVPEGTTKAAVLIAAAEQARKAKNFKAQKDLIIQRSFMQTRHGQEIVTERLVNDLSSDRFIRDVIKVRMDQVVKKAKKGVTKAKAFTDKVTTQAKGATRKVNKQVLNKVQSAQKILDNLICP